MIDLHVHTKRCRHATGEMGEYVAAAAEAGTEVLAFSDHLPLPPELNADYSMDAGELPGYVADVGEAARAGSELGVEVLLGIEADWLPDRVEDTRALLESASFDVVFGSVHFVDGWAFDDPDLVDRYGEWRAEELWDRYFAELVRAARCELFDAMAHIDLVKKFGCRPQREPLDLYAVVAAELAAAGVAIEVSTGGLRKPCAEIYPGDALLRAMCEAGVPATVGSDAHRPAEVGFAWNEAAAALRRAGYESVVVFRDRVAEEVVLP